jgi:hypothetical protein
MREFDVYIDRRRLPGWLLRDDETQVGAATAFWFDGDEGVTKVDDPSLVFRPPGVASCRFAHLDTHALTFKLVPSEDPGGRAVRVGSGSAELRIYARGSGVTQRLGSPPLPWAWLDWGRQYVVYDVTDDLLAMELEVRRVEVPVLVHSRRRICAP